MLRLVAPIRALSRSQAAAAVAPRCLRAMTTEADAAALETKEQGKPVKQKLTDPGCHRDMRRAFYIDATVDKVMNQMLGHPFRMWTQTRAEWYRLLSTRQGCNALLHSTFLSMMRSQIRERDLNATRKFGSHMICLGRSLDEQRRIKKDLYRYKYLSLCEAAKDAEATAAYKRSLEDQ